MTFILFTNGAFSGLPPPARGIKPAFVLNRRPLHGGQSSIEHVFKVQSSIINQTSVEELQWFEHWEDLAGMHLPWLVPVRGVQAGLGPAGLEAVLAAGASSSSSSMMMMMAMMMMNVDE